MDWSANWICPPDECEVTWEWCVEVVSVIYVDDDGFEFGSSKLESYSLASKYKRYILCLNSFETHYLFWCQSVSDQNEVSEVGLWWYVSQVHQETSSVSLKIQIVEKNEEWNLS